MATGPLTQSDGTPLSVHEQSLDEIWNSKQLRQIRHDLLEGKRVAFCEVCYQHEEAGHASPRTTSNQSWSDGWLNAERWDLAQLDAHSTAQAHRMPAPGSLELNLGNLCNLKCRMCHPGSSSRIARDPIQRQWSCVEEKDPRAREPSWWQIDAITRDLLRHPEQLRVLYLLGGEPLLIKEVGDFLKQLIHAGVAHRVGLVLSTNGTTTHAPWLKLLAAFESVTLSVSVDGFGPYYEYIRYPGRWAALVRNLAVLRQLPRTTLAAHVTLQVYNALHIVDLFRFLDDINIPFTVFSLHLPEYLCTSVLPPHARRRAAERLREYAEQDCLPDRRAMVRLHARALDAQGDGVDPKLLRQFMLFTNDLDVTRGQSLRATCPELVELIERAGFPWTNETLHAGRRPLPVVASAS